MSEEPVDRPQRDPLLDAERPGRFRELRHRETKQLFAVHPWDMRLLVEVILLPVGARPKAAARDVEEAGAPSVGVNLDPA